MKAHSYRITVEPLPTGEAAAAQRPPLIFETKNHDDLLAIVEKMRARGQFSQDEAAALAIGLKLFSEVMLNHRESDLFKPLQPCFGAFMKELKKG